MGRIVAFFSYTRADDEESGGRLSYIRQRMEAALRGATGDADVEIFQDTDDIKTGADWRRRLEQALADSVFLIPVVTPLWYASEPCQDEIGRFREKEREPGRDGIILPIYWIRASQSERAVSDDPRDFIFTRQWVDWREYRYPNNPPEELETAVIRFADDIAERLERLEQTVPDDAARERPVTVRAAPEALTAEPSPAKERIDRSGDAGDGRPRPVSLLMSVAGYVTACRR